MTLNLVGHAVNMTEILLTGNCRYRIVPVKTKSGLKPSSCIKHLGVLLIQVSPPSSGSRKANPFLSLFYRRDSLRSQVFSLELKTESQRHMGIHGMALYPQPPRQVSSQAVPLLCVCWGTLGCNKDVRGTGIWDAQILYKGKARVQLGHGRITAVEGHNWRDGSILVGW